MKTIKCPQCGAKFEKSIILDFEQAMRSDLEKEFQKKETEQNREINAQRKQLLQFTQEKIKADLDNTLKLKQRDKIIQELTGKIEEARKRAESAFSSQQNVGETQELYLEEILRTTFPQDLVLEVAKGVKGADAIQVIRTDSGHEVAKILYESKSTKVFSEGWIGKLRQDNLQTGAQAMVLVTSTMPKGSEERVIIKEGVFICTLQDVKQVVILLRYSLLKIQAITFSQNERESNRDQLYDYLTSDQFKATFEHVLGSFRKLQLTHNQEKLKMASLWKEREKMFEQILTQSVEFYGEIKGIVGVTIPELSTMEILPQAD